MKKLKMTVTASIMAGGIAVLTGCPQAGKTAADFNATFQCINGDWGKPVEVVAADCFGGVIVDAEDAIADATYLLQKQGAPPTTTAMYMNNARIAQKVLAKQAAAGAKGS